MGGFINLLAESPTTVTTADFQTVIDALTSQISVSSVVGVLVVVVTSTVGLAFMWWGVRKLVGAIMGAFRKGKVRV